MREMELKVAIGGQSFTTAKIEIDIISMRLRDCRRRRTQWPRMMIGCSVSMRSKIELAEILTVSNPSVGTEIPDERKGERERERERERVYMWKNEREKETKIADPLDAWPRARIPARCIRAWLYTRVFVHFYTYICSRHTHTHTHTHARARARAHTR